MHEGSSTCSFSSQAQYIGLIILAVDNWYIKKKPRDQRSR